ncbi:hypothetical protein [Paraburkholderia domus]|uniref:hypothetical protein n=1 Tax=Paraburkholderia domus TaxID=2793075 RepID=UPI001914D807|nr:hypothetical protein [Paraburkholderia domus]MBK5065742.1 hypothetical protein [Burkholderia sp. R-70199]
MNYRPEMMRDLQPAMAYRIETRGFSLSNGYFPGLLLERTFIKPHVVDGITFLEFQSASGSRQVIDATTIERLVPLGRAAMRADTLRQPGCAQT